MWRVKLNDFGVALLTGCLDDNTHKIYEQKKLKLLESFILYRCNDGRHIQVDSFALGKANIYLIQ